ncbi:hypothetical protein LINPERPRIM_LOCUS30341, partial [Linum perenne]
RNIAWSPLPDPWVTLNSDGSVNEHNASTASGVLRTNNGDFIAAYTMNFGAYFTTRAKIRGNIVGMKLAWDRGAHRLAI